MWRQFEDCMRHNIPLQFLKGCLDQPGWLCTTAYKELLLLWAVRLNHQIWVCKTEADDTWTLSVNTEKKLLPLALPQPHQQHCPHCPHCLAQARTGIISTASPGHPCPAGPSSVHFCASMVFLVWKDLSTTAFLTLFVSVWMSEPNSQLRNKNRISLPVPTV